MTDSRIFDIIRRKKYVRSWSTREEKISIKDPCHQNFEAVKEALVAKLRCLRFNIICQRKSCQHKMGHHVPCILSGHQCGTCVTGSRYSFGFTLFSCILWSKSCRSYPITTTSPIKSNPRHLCATFKHTARVEATRMKFPITTVIT
jgi:hypothetical protein